MDNPLSFENSWDNQTRAESYSKLEFPNTYYLAYRDLPEIISKHVTGDRAVDFGCGTGRSARFLERLGFRELIYILMILVLFIIKIRSNSS